MEARPHCVVSISLMCERCGAIHIETMTAYNGQRWTCRACGQNLKLVNVSKCGHSGKTEEVFLYFYSFQAIPRIITNSRWAEPTFKICKFSVQPIIYMIFLTRISWENLVILNCLLSNRIIKNILDKNHQFFHSMYKMIHSVIFILSATLALSLKKSTLFPLKIVLFGLPDIQYFSGFRTVCKTNIIILKSCIFVNFQVPTEGFFIHCSCFIRSIYFLCRNCSVGKWNCFWSLFNPINMIVAGTSNWFIEGDEIPAQWQWPWKMKNYRRRTFVFMC